MTEMMKAYVMQQPLQITFVDYLLPELEDVCVLLKFQRVSIGSTETRQKKTLKK
jgi:hypothetical protein